MSENRYYQEQYPGQFEPADLEEAYAYFYAHLKYGMPIQMELFPPEIQADFFLIKCIELSRFDRN